MKKTYGGRDWTACVLTDEKAVKQIFPLRKFAVKRKRSFYPSPITRHASRSQSDIRPELRSCLILKFVVSSGPHSHGVLCEGFVKKCDHRLKDVLGCEYWARSSHYVLSAYFI